MKNIKLKCIIVMMISFGVIFYILKDNFVLTMHSFLKANRSFILLGFISYSIAFMIDSYSLYIIVKEHDKNYSFKKAYELNIMTKFFNGITPFSSGGQPLQVYQLHKEGIDYTNSISICLKFNLIFQLAFTIISSILILINILFNIINITGLLKIFMYIGYSINLLLLLLIIMMSFSKTFNKKIINFIIKILYKLKIVKNKKEMIEKWDKKCNDLYNSVKEIKKKKKIFFIGTLLQILYLIFYYIIPMIIIYSFTKTNINILNTIIISNQIHIISSYVPIPGGSIGIEYCFTNLFRNFIFGGIISPILLVWRFITYFLPIIIGAIIFNTRVIKLNK